MFIITIKQIVPMLSMHKRGALTKYAIVHTLVAEREELIFLSKPTTKKITSSIVLECDPVQVGPIGGRRGVR